MSIFNTGNSAKKGSKPLLTIDYVFFISRFPGRDKLLGAEFLIGQIPLSYLISLNPRQIFFENLVDERVYPFGIF